MGKSPCFNCQDRAIPKNCEKDCVRWAQYRTALKKQRNIEKFNKWGGLYD